MIDYLRKFLAVHRHTRVTRSGNDPTPNENLYLTPASLTFPGVTLFCGTLLNFLTTNFPVARIWTAAAIALIVGTFILYLGLSDPDADLTDKRTRNIAV